MPTRRRLTHGSSRLTTHELALADSVQLASIFRASVSETNENRTGRLRLTASSRARRKPFPSDSEAFRIFTFWIRILNPGQAHQHEQRKNRYHDHRLDESEAAVTNRSHPVQHSSPLIFQFWHPDIA